MYRNNKKILGNSQSYIFPSLIIRSDKQKTGFYFSVVLKKLFSFLDPQYPSVCLKHRINICSLCENLLGEDLAELHSLLVE